MLPPACCNPSSPPLEALTQGCYVSDKYIKTGTAEYVVKKCGGGGGGTTPAPSGSGPCLTLNAAGTKLVKEFEGFVKSPAPDPIGLPTVGYGHLCQTKGCGEVKYKFPLTEATATQLLNDDMPKYTKCLAKAINDKVKLNDNQWAALASFTFNMGCGAMADSSIIRRLNAGEDKNKVVSEEFPKWVNAGGKKLAGLVRRRNAEIALFKTASSKQAHPSCA